MPAGDHRLSELLYFNFNFNSVMVCLLVLSTVASLFSEGPEEHEQERYRG